MQKYAVNDRALAAYIAFVWLAVAVLALVAGNTMLGALMSTPLVMMVMGAMVQRALRARAARKTAIRKARDHTRWPKILRNTLKFNEGERVEYEKRMHPAVIFHTTVVSYSWKLLIPVFVAVAAPWFGFWILIPIALAVLCAMFVPAAADWWFTRRCFTNRRVIVVTGILRRGVKAIKRSEIRVPSHTEESVYNAVLRFFRLPEVWHWTFDTLVQDDPFKSLLWCHFPSPVGDLLEDHEHKTSVDS